MTRNVYLAQVNNMFGENKAFLPYSVGILQAYAKNQPDLKKAYRFAQPFFLRDPDLNKVAKSLDSPDVLGISAYTWNWEWSKALARAVRKQHPNSLIVMGGPQVPDRSKGFSREHPYVDLLVHGEGEIAFSDVLRERLKETPNYSNIKGLTVLNQQGPKSNYSFSFSRATLPRPRQTQEEVNGLPSPYLEGVFDTLLKERPDLEFHVTSETHRGCPYSCEFCVWGSNLLAKIKRFPEWRIRAEYDWAARKGIPMIYNADANFGIFPADEETTDYLIDLKSRTGFPQQIRANWAKNSHDRMYNMAKKLTDAGMGIGVTLSLQSLDSQVLKNIKRHNIKFDNFTSLAKKYKEAGIPTYTELILALPGETYETFAQGLETLFTGGQHNGINIYLCTLLENAGMNNPEYIKNFGLKSIRSPILQNHATPGEDPITEYSDTVIATNSMPPEDFRRTFLFSWAAQALHTLGPTQDISIYLKGEGVPYQSFYEQMLLLKPDTIFGQQIARTGKSLDRALSGGDWGEVDSKRYGNIIWPLEEKSFLDIATGDLNLFYAQVEEMINRRLISIPHEVIQDQMQRLKSPEDFGGDIKEYAKKVAWFGRKFGSLKNLEERFYAVAG